MPGCVERIANEMGNVTTNEERILRQCQEAWKELKTGRSWLKWLAVGEGLVLIRERANAAAALGGSYNDNLKELLVQYELTELHPVTRSQCLKMMDNLPAIREWLDGKSLEERLEWNHPNTVLRHWEEESNGSKVRTPPQRSTARVLKDEIERLEGVADHWEGTAIGLENEVAKLEKQIRDEQFEREGEVAVVRADHTDRDLYEIAIEMIERLTPARAEKFAVKIIAELPEEQALEALSQISDMLGFDVVKRTDTSSQARAALHALKVGGAPKPLPRKRLSEAEVEKLKAMVGTDA